MSYALSEMDRMLSGLIQPGSVEAVQLKPPRVRVGDGDGWTSGWVPWLAMAAGKARHWRPPSVGEQAILLCPSGEPAQGFALVGFYTDALGSDDRPDVVSWLMPDGAVIEYDHATGAALLDGCKTATINAADSVTVKSTRVLLDTPEAEITGNLKIGGALSQGGAGGGSATFAGDVNASGDVTAGGISLQQHHHTEQGDGAPTSAAQ